jgi:hypothetical protein
MTPKSLLALAVSLATALSAAAEDNPWTSRPELRQLSSIASYMIVYYSHWSDEYRKSGRTPSPADRTVNEMTEGIFVEVLAALRKTPNAALQKQCLLMLGEEVPTEFDRLWSMVLLEMDANLDASVSREVAEILKQKQLPALQDRAMRKKPK